MGQRHYHNGWSHFNMNYKENRANSLLWKINCLKYIYIERVKYEGRIELSENSSNEIKSRKTEMKHK